MKKSINLNYIWSKFFVDQLVSLGIKNICISPGSRSTPLTTAFAENKKTKKYVIVDERSSAFFALGLAKESGLPTAIVTTSGSATANLYPAIIEAYQSKIPLIVCTTDRPDFLRNTGANQTVNQVNLYGNHIRYFKDIPLPSLSIKSFRYLHKVTSEAVVTSVLQNRGPVHLNFQFEKPLEKSIHDINIDDNFINKLDQLNSSTRPLSASSLDGFNSSFNNKSIKSIIEKINRTPRGVIFVGWDSYDKRFLKLLIGLSKKINFPILADGASGIFLKSKHKNIIVNNQAFLRSEKFIKDYSPDLIIQFGNAPTSNTMLDFIKQSKAYKIAANQYGERKDSGQKFNKVIKAKPSDFCFSLIDKLEQKKDISYLQIYTSIDARVEKIKKIFFNSTKISDELKILHSIIESIPSKSNLFVSNSLPIRDLEFFKSKSDKNINLFVSRGASGIDGINSTAGGIAASSKNPTVLVTGDLSFFHDTNGLHTLMNYKIPLTIILINNGGGAIFGMLPIDKEEKIFNEYFFTPLNLDFSQLVKTYGASYEHVKTFNSLSHKIKNSITNKSFSVLEIKTNYQSGIIARKDYFRKIVTEIDKTI